MAGLSAIYEWELPNIDQPGSTVISVCVRIEKAELDRLLAAYDPNSGTSPSVSDARPVLRAILDAVIAAEDV
jgi:hypothetical protein